MRWNIFYTICDICFLLNLLLEIVRFGYIYRKRSWMMKSIFSCNCFLVMSNWAKQNAHWPIGKENSGESVRRCLQWSSRKKKNLVWDLKPRSEWIFSFVLSNSCWNGLTANLRSISASWHWSATSSNDQSLYIYYKKLNEKIICAPCSILPKRQLWSVHHSECTIRNRTTWRLHTIHR